MPAFVTKPNRSSLVPDYFYSAILTTDGWPSEANHKIVILLTVDKIQHFRGVVRDPSPKEAALFIIERLFL